MYHQCLRRSPVPTVASGGNPPRSKLTLNIASTELGRKLFHRAGNFLAASEPRRKSNWQSGPGKARPWKGAGHFDLLYSGREHPRGRSPMGCLLLAGEQLHFNGSDEGEPRWSTLAQAILRHSPLSRRTEFAGTVYRPRSDLQDRRKRMLVQRKPDSCIKAVYTTAKITRLAYAIAVVCTRHSHSIILDYAKSLIQLGFFFFSPRNADPRSAKNLRY